MPVTITDESDGNDDCFEMVSLDGDDSVDTRESGSVADSEESGSCEEMFGSASVAPESDGVEVGVSASASVVSEEIGDVEEIGGLFCMEQEITYSFTERVTTYSLVEEPSISYTEEPANFPISLQMVGGCLQPVIGIVPDACVEEVVQSDNESERVGSD